MKPTSARRVGAATLAAALTFSSLALAGPAAAALPGTWWTSYYDLADAGKVSTGRGVTVAVVDTGVQANLPDLAGRVLPGKSFVVGGTATTDIADPGAPYYGHGTAMAGFIAATGRGTGYRGVAPGATILPVGIANASAQLSSEATSQGIRYAVDKGAKVINVSSGEVRSCPPEMQQAVDYAARKDVIVVAAVGNTAGQTIGAPANCIGVIGIGVLADSSTFSAWSGQSSGPDVDFIAPGQNLSTLLLNRSYSKPDGTGSSESAAIASGAFALLRAKFPKDSARQIVTRAMYSLQNKAGKQNFGKRINDQIGYGALQPQFALTVSPPANAANPIYDQLDKHLAATAAGTGSAAPSSAASSPAPQAANDDGGGIPAGLIVAIVVLAVAVVVVIAVVVARSRRRPAAPGYGPPPGHGPPGGYGRG